VIRLDVFTLVPILFCLIPFPDYHTTLQTTLQTALLPVRLHAVDAHRNFTP
jgi:hypothetical protein